MCGLAGYIDFSGKAIEDNGFMLKMLELQRHRGPDDSGILGINTKTGSVEVVSHHSKEPIANGANALLGFNRLSILDLSLNGHQPMVSADKKVVLLMNGEIYNAFDFKEDLIKKGHSFKSTSDTEVVLNLYLEYGFDKTVKLLNGMFALVILDLNDGSLYLARDRFGIKPLYITEWGNVLSFSSELKSFKAIPGFSFQLNEELLDEFLLFRNVINRTLFKGIYNLEPGMYLRVSNDGSQKKARFYDVRNEGYEINSERSSIELIEETLEKSVQSQLMSDVKLGCQLSGGLDSSLVSYFANENVAKGQLETISITFNNPTFSEEKYVDYVAEKLNLRSHKYVLEPDYYINQLEAATWHFESPLNHPNTIGIYLLSQQARKHVTVLLSGEGADETMAGYNWFSQLQESPYLSRLFLSKLKNNRKRVLDFLKYNSDKEYRMVMASVFTNLEVTNAIKPDFKFDRATSHRYQLAKSISDSGLNKHRKYEMLTYLPDLLMRQDKMSMAHSIENRVPFLDNEMVHLALSMPAQKVLGKRNGALEGKLLLKELGSRKFSESFAFRQKMGFGIPLREFMKTPEFNEKLRDEWIPGIKRRGIFASKPIEKWSTDISKNPSTLDGLWLMTGFELWAKQYLDS